MKIENLKLRNWWVAAAALLASCCVTAEAQLRVATPYGDALGYPSGTKGNGKAPILNSAGKLVWTTPGGGGGAQTPWASDIDAAGFNLNNVGQINSSSTAPTLFTLGDGASHTITLAMPTNTVTASYTMIFGPLTAFAGGLWYNLSGTVMTPRAGVAGSGGDYLSPAANEWNAFTTKATPVSGDVLLIEDSAASGAKKKATVGSMPVAASQVTSGVLAMARLATGTPDGTKFVRDDGVLATPAGGGSTIGYTIKFGGTDTSFNPSSGGFTLYSGGTVFSVPSTSFTNQCVPIFKTGTIKGIGVRVRDDGTLGSSENVTFKISINGAAGSGTGVVMPISAINNLGTSTGESIAVTAGQTIALTFTTPTWATPPTFCYLEAWAYIE